MCSSLQQTSGMPTAPQSRPLLVRFNRIRARRAHRRQRGKSSSAHAEATGERRSSWLRGFAAPAGSSSSSNTINIPPVLEKAGVCVTSLCLYDLLATVTSVLATTARSRCPSLSLPPIRMGRACLFTRTRHYHPQALCSRVLARTRQRRPWMRKWWSRVWTGRTGEQHSQRPTVPRTRPPHQSQLSCAGTCSSAMWVMTACRSQVRG